MPSTPKKKATGHATERLSLRATEPDKTLLLAAAKRLRVPLTVYIIKTAVAKAESELLDETTIKLPPEKWKSFIAALDRPVQKKPRLHKLLTQPTIFGRR